MHALLLLCINSRHHYSGLPCQFCWFVLQYGPPGRGIDNSACLNCSFAGTGFSFEVNATNILYQPRAVSRLEANFSGDCLTEFTQIVDKAW
jgi:hypothetical protein